MFVFTLIVCVSQIVMWYGDLPDLVPSHFDGNGQVDGHMGRDAFCLTMGLINLSVLIGLPVLGMLMKYIPNSLINMPNKEYWLAGDRRETSLKTNADFLTAIGWMTSWLFIAIFQLSGLVAIKARETINPEFFFVMAIFLIAVVTTTVVLMMKFRMPKSDGNVSASNNSLGPISR